MGVMDTFRQLQGEVETLQGAAVGFERKQREDAETIARLSKENDRLRTENDALARERDEVATELTSFRASLEGFLGK